MTQSFFGDLKEDEGGAIVDSNKGAFERAWTGSE
jgi:hypothetical protein